MAAKVGAGSRGRYCFLKKEKREMDEVRQKLRERLREVPHKPGVYLFRDRFRHVIYVGKARDLRRRLSSYFVPSALRRATIKTRSLVESTWSFEWHEVRNEAEAVLLEGRLIKDFRPKYNVAFRDDKRFPLLRVHLGDPYPRFEVVRIRKEDGARYFGPYPDGRAVRATLDALVKNYGLRSCKVALPDEGTYRHCHDDVIRNCSAPCIGRVTREEYMERVRRACEFLEGNAGELIELFEQRMHEAAAVQDFERAAQLRDLVADLRATARQITRFTRKSLPVSEDPARDLEALKEALGLPRVPVLMECFDISNISSTHIVASMVRFRNGEPETSAYRRYRIRTVEQQDDFASMAEVVRRRYSRVLREGAAILGEEAVEYGQEGVGELMERVARAQDAEEPQRAAVRLPDLIVVDGGRGQLNAACRELQRLGLYDVPVIGLAKEFEEIYRPGHPVPLRLPEDSGALRMLQRLRDEAHRFANKYHSLLLKKRMTESLLDSVPGVSAARKKALLRRFGSVAGVRKATVEQVLEVVPGLGEKGARELLRRLRRGGGGEGGGSAEGSAGVA